MNRKYNIAALLLAILLMLTMFGCRRQEPQQPEQPEQPSVETPDQPQPQQPEPPQEPQEPQQPQGPQPLEHQRKETRETIKNDDGEELISILLAVPQVEAHESITTYYADWLSDSAYYIGLQEETAQEAYEDAKDGIGYFHTYFFESDYEVVRNDGVLFTVVRDYYENTGGAHPGYAMMAENFIAENGKILVLDDVFTVSQQVYDQRIRQMVLEQIEEKVAADGLDPYYEGFEDTLMEIYNRQDFCLTNDGLMVFWPTYAIAPYVAGVQQFTLPYDALADIMDSRWMVE